MAQRPERLMATKVYGKENARAKKVSDSTKTLVPTVNNIQNGRHANEKGALDERIPKLASKESTGRKTPTGNKEQKGIYPVGFVTREEMINRVYNRRSKTTDAKDGKDVNTLRERKRNKIPAGFVTREEMEVRVFIRKMNASNGNTSSLYGNPSAVGNVTPVFIKPKSTPRPIKATPTPGKPVFNKENMNGPSKQSKNTPRIQNSLSPTERNMHTNYEQDTAASEGESISAIPNGQVQAIVSKRIASSSTVESGFVVTERSTSTAITRQAKQQPNSSGLNSLPVKVLVMNASGNDDKRGSVPERRRQAIQNIVVKHKPDVVLFQEFSWKGIRGKTWSKHPIPEQFEYTGHYDASIMYHNETFKTVQNLPATALDNILRQLQSNSNNRLERPFPNDFNPISRMCAKIITTFAQPSLEFICISWHGSSNKKSGGRLKELTKIEYFEYWMEFLRNIREKFNLPILAAGDYNVKMLNIAKFVQSPFKLCKYEGSKRRTDRGIIDFCIITDDLELGDTTWVDLERDTSVEHPNSILDHDPLVATLNASTFGATGAAMGFGKKKSWPSPIVKMK